jgi:hypothetical protein
VYGSDSTTVRQRGNYVTEFRPFSSQEKGSGDEFKLRRGCDDVCYSSHLEDEFSYTIVTMCGSRFEIIVLEHELTPNPSLEKRGASQFAKHFERQSLPFSFQEKGQGDEFKL